MNGGYEISQVGLFDHSPNLLETGIRQGASPIHYHEPIWPDGDLRYHLDSNPFLDDHSESGLDIIQDPFKMNLNHSRIEHNDLNKHFNINSPIEGDSTFLISPSPLSTDSPKSLKPTKEKKQSKGDEMRNLYPNVMKVTVTCILKEKVGVFRNKLLKIWSKVRLDEADIDFEEFLNFCETMKSNEYSLKDINRFMCYTKSEGKERTCKRIFHDFLVWFLDRRYSVYVLRSDQCEHKKKYLRGKNLLKYLPNVRPRKGQPQNTSL